jgi:polysaccharide biosynthesis protein PslG
VKTSKKQLFHYASFLLLILICIAIASVGLWQFWVKKPFSEEVISSLRIESSAWQTSNEVELSLIAEPVYAGKTVTVTVLAPGAVQDNGSSDLRGCFGLAGVQLVWLPPDQQEKEIALAAATGARYIGLDFDWRRIEPEPGKFHWDDLDRVVDLAKQYNLTLVPMLLYTPRWASSIAFAPLDYQRAPPRRYEDYKDFVYTVVKRYKPYGESSLTGDGYGIRDWVIWNEPNTHKDGEMPNPGEFWTGGLEAYIQLLRAGYEGAHAADPGCNVLNGALTDVFWTGDGSDIISALERFYDPDGDGDAADGARPFFDTLNIHLYQLDTPDAGWYRQRLNGLREVVVRFGDESKPLWITETGYGSMPEVPNEQARGDFTYVSESTQAEALRMVYEDLSDYPGLERVFWWSLRDYHQNNSQLNTAMEAHFGLLRANFSPKPAYLTYAQITGSVSQSLSLSVRLDEQGLARVSVPASFILNEGSYLVFAQLDEKTVTTVANYQVVSK